MAPDDRRRAIVDVVVPLLLEHGSGVTTRRIAEAAEIAEGTIFGVFEDKLALWTAVAQRVLDPATELDELARVVGGRDDLRAVIVRVADHLLERSQRVMAVMMVMREVLSASHRDDGAPRRPPAFLLEADRALMTGLTDLFDPHRAELGVEPATAATVLRSLVLGTRHPGAHADYRLSPEEVADVMLGGVLRQPVTQLTTLSTTPTSEAS